MRALAEHPYVLAGIMLALATVVWLLADAADRRRRR